jgi:hypothetical protein
VRGALRVPPIRRVMKYFWLMISGMEVSLSRCSHGLDFNHHFYGTKPTTLAPIVERLMRVPQSPFGTVTK